MKVFNSKLAAIGLAAFVFASCSDSSSDPASPINPGTVPSEITKIGLTQTDAAQLAASVTNYKRSSSNKARTRAFNETLFNGLTQMPDVPSNEDAVQLNAAKDLSNEKYKTRNGKTYDFSNNTLQNATLFVVGNSTVKYNNLGTGNTIIVQKGGKLEYTGNGTAIPQNNTIIVLESGSYSIANDITIDGTLYSSRALGKIEGKITDKKSEGTPTQNITINGSVFLSGYKHKVTDPESENYGKELTEYASLRAKKLTINAGARVNTLDRVTFTNDVVIEGALHVGQTAIVKNMTIKNGGKFYSDYSAKIKNNLTMEPGSYMDLAYLNVTDNKYDKNGTEEKPTKTIGDAVADLKGNCQIVIGNHGVMSFNTLKTDNTAGQIVMGDDANNVAVIKADKFIYAGSDENVNFTSTPNTNNQIILAQFKEIYKNGAESVGNKVDFEYLNWNADVQSYDYITGGGALIAGDNFSYKLKEEYKVADQKKLMLLSTIANYDRDTQSATAIVPTDNNKVYVSYHTNGAEFGGSIDVAEMNGEQLTLKQRVEQAATGATYDFNHLNVIDDKLYLAGGIKGKSGLLMSGASISYAAINSDGTLNVTEGLTSTSIDNAIKGDANCVVPFGNQIVVANTKGYDKLEKDLTDDKSTQTPGKAKFVAVNGSSLVGLNYKTEITAGNDPVDGEIQVFNSSMEQTSSFNVGSIAPNNGKNMIAIDSDGRIYVCKSAKGLMCYESNGNPAWTSEWTTPVSHGAGNVSVDNRQGYINGVAVDDNYVYVAAGAYGLVVLNKNGEEVTHKRIGTAGNSANYVAVKNGLIYVAYGKGRIQVFKLTSGAAQ
jgi:hypothetical protein